MTRAVPADVSRARPADAAALDRLQGHLEDSTPELLSYGLSVDGVLVSADEAGVPVGYALLVESGIGTHLAELVVAPDRRREGRGRALLRAVLAGADGPVTLLVAADNRAARSLYEDAGFAVEARRSNEYGSRDALLYRCDCERVPPAPGPSDETPSR